jgi:radical SAM superfamily enzyme YgiQ (UPF0313 family)
MLNFSQKQADLILIQSPCWTTYSPPYNLALLKAVCQQRGYRVICLDFNIEFYKYLTKIGKQCLFDKPTNWYNNDFVRELINAHSKFIDQCVQQILEIDSRIVGFTITGLNRIFSEEIAKRVKQKDKGKIILFGGPHCFRLEINKVLLYVNPDLDVVCHHEGDRVLPNLLGLIKKDGKLGYCPGIAFRNEHNEIIDCPDIELIEDLNSLPFADYSDFPLDDYHTNGQPDKRTLPISTSRGCVNRCAFCSESISWAKYRFRNANNIFDEIVFQTTRYPGIKSFFFNDSLINGNLEMLEALCDLLISNKINIQWGGQAIIREGMSKELLLKMKKAGCAHMTYGLESLSPKILKMIGKRFTPELAQRVIRDTAQAGIKISVTIIVGLPTETDEDVLMTADFLKYNKDFVNNVLFHLFVVSRGTFIYNHRDVFGIELEDDFNSIRWHSKKEINTLEKRLGVLEFYNKYIGENKSFYSPEDYYLFIADKYFEKKDYASALKNYLKAQEINKDSFKTELIKDKITLTTEVSSGEH